MEPDPAVFVNSIEVIAPSAPPVSNSRKRNSTADDGDSGSPTAPASASASASASARRPKRAKYTSVACEECKKRKLKCNPTAEGSCERCDAGGLACVFTVNAAALSKEKKTNIDSQHLESLSNDISQLRQEMSELVSVVRDMREQMREQSQDQSHVYATVSSHSRETRDAGAMMQSPASTHRGTVPKQPQFVGPTRSAFGLLVGERSLNRMGIPTFDSLPPSGAQSPIEASERPTATDVEFWERCTPGEFTKFLVVFQEEIESVYPFIEISTYSGRSQEILNAIRQDGVSKDDGYLNESTGLTSTDLMISRVAVATGMVLETHGRSDLSSAIIEPVERSVSSIFSPPINLAEIQLLTMLSIYYFHCDEELLAWRTIGIAARETLEMGLHRKRSLHDHFKDPDSQRLATRVFWCVYVLDRRWSFGTSLSFALVDKDIDPELPKPDDEYSDLRCMVGYGQLSSKIWDAIPSFGSASHTIPEDTTTVLDICIQDWLNSIPQYLQLRHPRLGLAPRSQPRLLHRLRALLYLRGNYARIIIYRHYLMSASSISANPKSAWLVVDIAQDTIQVLVHLHATSDIYSRQQNAFNYFLLSALAVIFLAVCHAPASFASPCRRSFLEGVDLLRGLSRHSIVSRRLWNSIRHLVPRMRSLRIQNSELKPPEDNEYPENHDSAAADLEATAEIGRHASSDNDHLLTDLSNTHTFSQIDNIMIPEFDITHPVPDMYQMSHDLLSLFDAFEQGQQLLQPIPGSFNETGEVVLDEKGDEISRMFQELI